MYPNRIGTFQDFPFQENTDLYIHIYMYISPSLISTHSLGFKREARWMNSSLRYRSTVKVLVCVKLFTLVKLLK